MNRTIQRRLLAGTAALLLAATSGACAKSEDTASSGAPIDAEAAAQQIESEQGDTCDLDQYGAKSAADR